MGRIAYNGSGYLTFYQQLATKNPCYKQGKYRDKTTHLILHSTWADNPNLKRYVTPDDGWLGENIYRNGWNTPTEDTLVHAVIGKNKNGFVEAYQIAPWKMRVWGCGGDANGYAIQVEMCEDKSLGLGYAKECYNVAVKLFAHLAKVYNIPTANIWSHDEAGKKGQASDHDDPEHWWKAVKWKVSMDDFRRDVQALLDGEKEPAALPSESTAALMRVQVGAFSIKKNAEYKKQALQAAGYDAFVTQVDGYWKVQVGAFRKRENAENYVKKLQKDGFTAIIVKVK